MTQENKQLLLKDLCARLPYKTIVKVNDTQGIMDEIDIPNERIFVSNLNPFLYGGARASWFTVNGDKIYPYLRPMSSMTEEEKKYISDKCGFSLSRPIGGECVLIMPVLASEWLIDFYNEHYIDYRGWIEKGLALEALEGMYETEKQKN